MVLIVALVIACAACGAAAQDDMKLLRMDMGYSIGAMCLDGSAMAYYIRRNFTSNKWVIFFEGGGWCYNIEDCYERSNTPLGSSRHYSHTMTSRDIFSNNATENPDFYTWNAVFMKHCDGGSWIGNRREPVVYNNTKLYFRGLHGLNAALFAWMDQGMASATDILISGCASGALATYLHVDYLAQAFPRTRVKAVPIGGFYLNYPNFAGEYVFESLMKGVFEMQNGTFGVNHDCIHANRGREEACIFAETTLPHIQTAIFPLNSLYDDWQMKCILAGTQHGCNQFPEWDACLNSTELCTQQQMVVLNRWRASLENAIISTPTFTNPQNGCFLTSCVGHCEPVITPSSERPVEVLGIDAITAISKWYFHHWNNNSYIDCVLNDTPPIACNPTCSSF